MKSAELFEPLKGSLAGVGAMMDIESSLNVGDYRGRRQVEVAMWRCGCMYDR